MMSPKQMGRITIRNGEVPVLACWEGKGGYVSLCVLKRFLLKMEDEVRMFRTEVCFSQPTVWLV